MKEQVSMVPAFKCECSLNAACPDSVSSQAGESFAGYMILSAVATYGGSCFGLLVFLENGMALVFASLRGEERQFRHFKSSCYINGGDRKID